MKEENPKVFVPQQFENQANPMVHRHHTALEILEQVAGNIDGFCSGIGTGGTNVAAALKLAKKLGKGKTVVTILPDTAERYFSTPLFE